MVNQIKNSSIDIVQEHFVILCEPPDELSLDCGKKLGPITLAYETYGELSPKKDNVILVLHALSGNHHAAGRYTPDDKHPGWWDDFIGPGKAFDTDRYLYHLFKLHRRVPGFHWPLLY